MMVVWRGSGIAIAGKAARAAGNGNAERGGRAVARKGSRRAAGRAAGSRVGFWDSCLEFRFDVVCGRGGYVGLFDGGLEVGGCDDEM